MDFKINNAKSSDFVNETNLNGEVKVNKNSENDKLPELIANTGKNDDEMVTIKKRKISCDVLTKEAAKHELDAFREYFNEENLKFYPECSVNDGAVSYYFFRDSVEYDRLYCFQKIGTFSDAETRKSAYDKMKTRTEALLSLAKRLGLGNCKEYKALSSVYNDTNTHLGDSRTLDNGSLFLLSLDGCTKDLIKAMAPYDHINDEYRENIDDSINLK